MTTEEYQQAINKHVMKYVHEDYWVVTTTYDEICAEISDSSHYMACAISEEDQDHYAFIHYEAEARKERFIKHFERSFNG